MLVLAGKNGRFAHRALPLVAAFLLAAPLGASAEPDTVPTPLAAMAA